MKDVYVGLFTPNADGTVSARVPDMPSCITWGSDLADAINSATDALQGIFIVMEDTNRPIPVPSALADITIPDGAIPSMVVVDTVAYRRLTDQRAIRKTISMPAWMAEKSERLGLSLSQVTQDALRAAFTQS